MRKKILTAKVDVPSDGEILQYIDREQPVRCPRCGCGDPAQVQVRYLEKVKCKACRAETEGYLAMGQK